MFFRSAPKDKNTLVVHSLGHAVLVFLYIAFVAWSLFNIGPQFRSVGFLDPLALLLLFVLSATIVGTLVLGRPIVLYLDGKKKEGLQFFGYTIMWLFLFTVFMFLLLAVISIPV